MLHLERPLVLLDLEATGTDPKEARVIQIALQRFVPVSDGASLNAELDVLVDPETEIPPAVTDLTGITQNDVQGHPTFREFIPKLRSLIEDADLAGYNAIAYDAPLLKAEFERYGESLPGPSDRVIVDPYRLEQVLRPRTLTALYERYTGRTLENAHDAMSDVRAAGSILQHQLQQHDLSGTPAELADLTRGEYLDDGRKLKRDGESVVVCFGKHSGKTLRDLRTEHRDYFEWMYETIDELRPHLDDILDDPLG